MKTTILRGIAAVVAVLALAVGGATVANAEPQTAPQADSGWS